MPRQAWAPWMLFMLASACATPSLGQQHTASAPALSALQRGGFDEARRQAQERIDADGKDIPEGDPRRKPTFRFDSGDIAWARAFVSFERALLDLVLAYDWTGVDTLVANRARNLPDAIVIRLAHADRISAAKERI